MNGTRPSSSKPPAPSDAEKIAKFRQSRRDSFLHAKEAIAKTSIRDVFWGAVSRVMMGGNNLVQYLIAILILVSFLVAILFLFGTGLWMFLEGAARRSEDCDRQLALWCMVFGAVSVMWWALRLVEVEGEEKFEILF